MMITPFTVKNYTIHKKLKNNIKRILKRMLNEEVEKIKALLKNREEVELAYIFGSAIKGHGWKKNPDIDIAILINIDRITFGEEVAEFLEKELKRDVDIVLLNYAPILLKFEVIRNGRILFYRDLVKKVEFEVRNLLEFYELEPIRKWSIQQMKKLIREDRI